MQKFAHDLKTNHLAKLLQQQQKKAWGLKPDRVCARRVPSTTYCIIMAQHISSIKT